MKGTGGPGSEFFISLGRLVARGRLNEVGGGPPPWVPLMEPHPHPRKPISAFPSTCVSALLGGASGAAVARWGRVGGPTEATILGTATLSIGVGNNPGGDWGAGSWRNLEELMRWAACFLASWPPCSPLAAQLPLTHCSLCESLVVPRLRDRSRAPVGHSGP